MNTVTLAVNGTLMRGLELEQNLLSVGGSFLSEARTAPLYRLWSVDDKYPAMMKCTGSEQGICVALELWRIPAEGLAAVLAQEPEGLSIGRVVLENGQIVPGVLAEPWLVEGKKEISAFGGWRAYLQKL